MKLSGVWTMVAVAGLLWTGTATCEAQLSPAQHKQLVETSRWLAKCGIGYNQQWCPPGEEERWLMDCSNTVRYIYRKALGRTLPRVASSQYYVLKQENLVTQAPRREDGAVDTEKLFEQLRSGDLLFWEWTYNIKRTPPVSHVMIYLGKTRSGVPKMVGAVVSSRGEVTKSGGIDVYPFDPNAPCGGVKNFFGQYVKRGRFVGFGRPFQKPEVEEIASVAEHKPKKTSF